MHRSTSEFAFTLLIFRGHVNLIFKVIFRKLMTNLSIPFGFYSGNCFDRFVVLFNSQTCVCECPVGVNCS